MQLIRDTASSEDIEHDSMSSPGNNRTNESRHLFNCNTNDTSLSSVRQYPAPKLSYRGKALKLNRKEEMSLVDAEGRSLSDGSTSPAISECMSPADVHKEYADNIEQYLALKTTDMRLRFNNKRHRNGNPSCTYEAFKPTRFNLYKTSDEPSWSTIKRNDSLESASPTIKKKSVTAKLNPLIGARLARDESPPGLCYCGGTGNQKYTVTQKYEDKIRALQQQRQKERSRRRNYSSRGDENLDVRVRRNDNLDRTFSPDMHPLASYPEFYKYRSNPSPNLPPPYYLICDEGDSVAIQLNDVVLESQQVKNDKTKKGKDKWKYKSALQAPVDLHNDNYQQETSQYLFRTDNQPRKHKEILQNLGSHKRILQSYRNGSNGLDNFHQNDNKRSTRQYTSKHESVDVGHDFVFIRGSEVARSENSERSSNSPVNTSNEGNVISKSRTTERKFGKKLQSNGTIEYVTIRSGEIARPCSPRLVMAETKDVTFKQISPHCRNEDVASFLVQSIENGQSRPQQSVGKVSKPVEPTIVNDVSTREQRNTNVMQTNIVHQRVALDCDVADVAKNISQHLTEFCKADDVEREVELLVTDLDGPNAASPLSGKGKLHNNIRCGKILLRFHLACSCIK